MEGAGVDGGGSFLPSLRGRETPQPLTGRDRSQEMTVHFKLTGAFRVSVGQKRGESFMTVRV